MEKINISDDFAKDIADALNKTANAITTAMTHAKSLSKFIVAPLFY